MYERKIPVDLSCPLRLTMSLINSKWKSCILDELRNGPIIDAMIAWGEENRLLFKRKFGKTD